MIFNTENTKEQKLASRERYLAQEAKAKDMLQTDNLYDYIEGLKYSYSFCMRYKKNLQDLILFKRSFKGSVFINPFREVINDSSLDAKTPLDKCLKCGILKPWNDTYWFDKEKAESLQQYILEHSN